MCTTSRKNSPPLILPDITFPLLHEGWSRKPLVIYTFSFSSSSHQRLDVQQNRITWSCIHFFHVVLSLCSHFSMKFNRGYVNLLNYILFILRVYHKPEYIYEYLHGFTLRVAELSVHNSSWFHLLICIESKIIEWIRSKMFYIKFSCSESHCFIRGISMTVKPYREI